MDVLIFLIAIVLFIGWISSQGNSGGSGRHHHHHGGRPRCRCRR